MTKKQKIEASKLTKHLGYWMRVVSNHVSYSFARKLEDSGVTVAEWVVLREMYGGNDTTSPSTVAELTGLTRGAISKLIARLLEKGLVSRKESPNDRRYQEVELTVKGNVLVPKLALLADKNDDEFFSCLNKIERSQLKTLMQKLADHSQIKTVPTK